MTRESLIPRLTVNDTAVYCQTDTDPAIELLLDDTDNFTPLNHASNKNKEREKESKPLRKTTLSRTDRWLPRRRFDLWNQGLAPGSSLIAPPQTSASRGRDKRVAKRAAKHLYCGP